MNREVQNKKDRARGIRRKIKPRVEGKKYEKHMAMVINRTLRPHNRSNWRIVHKSRAVATKSAKKRRNERGVQICDWVDCKENRDML